MAAVIAARRTKLRANPRIRCGHDGYIGVASRGHSSYIDQTMRIGTRELKNSLSVHLRRVRGGETIYVTDRGKPIARISPIAADPSREAELLLLLAADGLITQGDGKYRDFKPARPRRAGGKLASRMIIDDRG